VFVDIPRVSCGTSRAVKRRWPARAAPAAGCRYGTAAGWLENVDEPDVEVTHGDGEEPGVGC
jgi:hypothetical protein